MWILYSTQWSQKGVMMTFWLFYLSFCPIFHRKSKTVIYMPWAPVFIKAIDFATNVVFMEKVKSFKIFI